jgi:hypothetical protein
MPETPTNPAVLRVIATHSIHAAPRPRERDRPPIAKSDTNANADELAEHLNAHAGDERFDSYGRG